MTGDRIHEVFMRKLFSETTQNEAKERISWICKHVAGKNVLDIGCSQGTVAVLLARDGMNVIGVDIDDDAIQYAKGVVSSDAPEVKKRIEFKSANILDLQLEDNSFDSIILGQFIEHVSHPESYLKFAHKRLKVNGRIIITVPFGLFSHDDHMQTYYLSNFLTLVLPYFDLKNFEIVNKRIHFAGDYKEFNSISSTTDLVNYQEINKLSEDEFANIEKKNLLLIQNLQSFLKKGNEKIKVQSTKMDVQFKQIQHLQKEIKHLGTLQGSKEKEILVLQNKKHLLENKNTNSNEKINCLEKRCQVLETDKLTFKQMGEAERIAKEKQDQLVQEMRSKIKDYENDLKMSANKLERLERKKGNESTKNNKAGGSLAEWKNSFWYRLGTHFRTFGYNHPTPGKQNKFISGKPRTSEIENQLNKVESKVSIATIMDVFTTACFNPSAKLVTFRPDEYKKHIDKNLDMLFVESAWHGNGGSWQYKIASYARNMGDELIDLLQDCKKMSIPTVFWNKEDPVHFDRFINKAKLFDYIFTTDDRCVPNYKKEVGHSNVFALPFAAQPLIHNPISEENRKDAACFAGSYYASRHEQRREDMDNILKPCLDMNLEIFDRNHGTVGKNADQFRFPEIYRSAIKGRLEYDEMVKAYKRYRVFLNVNSVKDSGTMFSRRVFELLASGTPVISTYSKGIEKLFPGVVLLTESEDETRQHLSKLFSDNDYWTRLSAQGIRAVLKEHTYKHRLDFIIDKLGIKDKTEYTQSGVTVISLCNNSESLEKLAFMLKRQTIQKFTLYVISKTNILNNYKEILTNMLPNHEIKFWVQSECDDYSKISESIKKTKAGRVVVMMPEGCYGKYYLEDHCNSEAYFPSGLVSRHSYLSENGSDRPTLKNKGYEHSIVNGVPTACISFDISKISQNHIRQILLYKWFKSEEPIFSLHRFGYIEGSGNSDYKMMYKNFEQYLDA